MTLFLVATPIGNLQDISQRALSVLEQADLILCEDTRVSLKLLHRFQLQKPLQPFHKFNEHEQLEPVLSRLRNGEKIALISDAGTPGLCDPGQNLVRQARLEGLEVTPIPGACSVICALIASGLPTHPFSFNGFIEKHKKTRQQQLSKALDQTSTQIFFESPERILSTVEELSNLEPTRHIALTKEISKIYETFFLGTAEQALIWLRQASTKGEWIVLIEGKLPEESKAPLEGTLAAALEHTQHLMAKGLSKSDAVTAISELFNIKAQELYKLL